MPLVHYNNVPRELDVPYSRKYRSLANSRSHRLSASSADVTYSKYAWEAAFQHLRRTRKRPGTIPIWSNSHRYIAAIQGGQTNNPSKNEVRDEVGLDVSHHTRISQRGGEKCFYLTSSFIG
jgi:hypothetical protein